MTEAEYKLESRLWKSLKDDRTVMLGLAGVEEGHSQPMSAQILHDEDERGPIWFFTSTDSDLVRALTDTHRAVVHFSSKGHDLFASLHGALTLDNNRQIIDQLWNSFIAAWYEGGKEDPKLQLLRLDPERAQVWLNENNLWAAVKLLLGSDPKKDYKDKVGDVRLGTH
ncbi:MAG TPA: pyridoxamine 5'-phosphate oxidase family protein [Steroidobacteraceae bacterium]|nr:pyridoxamine 5'-phosphate oxidase family protein [Steroidobacteraceae bacterium]